MQSDQSVRAFRTRDFIEVNSGLGQTSALHVFWCLRCYFPCVWSKELSNRTDIVKDLTESQRNRTLRTLVNQGYGRNTNFSTVNHV